MLKPTVVVREDQGMLVAEFWDCLRLDPAPVQDLRRHFEDHLRRGGRPDVIVDLNGVDFAGSSALGGFLGLQKIIRQQEGRMIFCNVEPQVREVFRVSKLDTVFSFADDIAAALELLRTGGTPSGPPEGAATSPGDTGSGAAGKATPPPSSRPSSPPPLRGRRRTP